MLQALLVCLVAQAVSAAEPSLGRIYHPGQESAWVFEAGGLRLGHHVSCYLGEDVEIGVRAHHFQGSYRLKVAPSSDAEARSTADLWTDDHGHPLRFVQQVYLRGKYSRVELTVAGKSSRAIVVQDQYRRETLAEVDPSSYLLANNFVSHIELFLTLLPPGKDARLKLFSGSNLKELDYTLTAKGTFELGGSPQQRGSGELSSSGERRSSGEQQGSPVQRGKGEQRDPSQDTSPKSAASAATGELYEDSLTERLKVAGGRLLEVGVESQNLVIRRTDEHFDPVRVIPPEITRASSAFDVEDVRIQRGDALIAGSVTKKKRSEGRMPAVFFISGSGPQDRNGLASGLDLGTHEILDGLTERGFLVLRVDDRGTGESSILPPNSSYLDLVADARAALDFLMKRDDVDPKRVALIGHGEGAETGAILALERPEIAAIVLMAPAGRSIIEVSADQNRLALEKSGLGREDVEKRMKSVRAFLVKLASDEPIDADAASGDEHAGLASRAWFQSHAKQDPIGTLRKLKCPVLILQGAKDFQASATKDAGALEAALKDAHHPDHELRVFPELDHLFKRTPGEKSEVADYWKVRPVDEDVLKALEAWLATRMKLE